VLIDERAASQAEFLANLLKTVNGSVLIGRHTAGAFGQVQRVALAGGFIFMFPAEVGPDKQRKGVLPDVEVNPTIQGVRTGRDEILEEAQKYVLTTSAPEKQ
jgi:C-terminal processing protease CtpA/Prc